MDEAAGSATRLDPAWSIKAVNLFVLLRFLL